jgi:hypothetical protein
VYLQRFTARGPCAAPQGTVPAVLRHRIANAFALTFGMAQVLRLSHETLTACRRAVRLGLLG